MAFAVVPYQQPLDFADGRLQTDPPIQAEERLVSRNGCSKKARSISCRSASTLKTTTRPVSVQHCLGLRWHWVEVAVALEMLGWVWDCKACVSCHNACRGI